jgi:hypothetical protein
MSPGTSLAFTSARATHVLDLTRLAPDIQAVVLQIEAVDGVEPVSERELRVVVRLVGWGEQRAVWVAVGRGKLSKFYAKRPSASLR